MKLVRLLHSSIIAPYVGDFGTCYELDNEEAARLVTSGFAEYSPEPEHDMWAPPVFPLDPTGYDAETGELVYEEPAPAPAVGQPKDEEQDSDELKKPYGNRPKSEWAAYAVSKGANPETVEEMTKADLMSLYGERL